jgi:2-polyprenyl-6-methoxyphenol hydroxylase-like FAD-dependent oxidoreductase
LPSTDLYTRCPARLRAVTVEIWSIRLHIACVGGGPAGLYLAILMKQAEPDHRVVVYERKPRHSSDGWGVVFWDDLLDDLRRTDAETAWRVAEQAFRWHGQQLVLDGEPVRIEAGGYGIGRSAFLDILRQRASDVGVELEFDREIRGPAELDSADVVVASDGANSLVRQTVDEFGTSIVKGQNTYVWLGTDRIFDTFTFAFERTNAGWIWFHAYAFDDRTSTCIIECGPETRAGLGLDELSAHESLAVLEKVFRRDLDGSRLMSSSRDDETLPWLNFRTVTNERWHSDRTVLVGDAAHTTHFSIGSGTRLAIQDAIALATALQHADSPQSAFEEYEKARRAGLLPAQHEARLSSQWFESVERYERLPAPAFFALLRARRDPMLPRVSPQLYYRVYASVDRIPALRSARAWAGPRARALYSRLKRRQTTNAHPS